MRGGEGKGERERESYNINQLQHNFNIPCAVLGNVESVSVNVVETVPVTITHTSIEPAVSSTE